MLTHSTLQTGKGYAVTVYAPDDATYKRLILAVEAINPAAFQPVSEGVAEAIRRDVLPRASFPPFDDDTGEPYVIPGCATGACGVD